jgi:endo-1,4-beta-xylanase
MKTSTINVLLGCSIVLIASGLNLRAQLADGQPKFLGNIVGDLAPPSFSTYWNQVTPGNSGKWGSVEEVRNVMDWTKLDRAYNYAKSNSFPFKQHTLVWGNQEPAWVSSLSPAEQAAEVEEWIRLFGERYPDAEFIDVVNEPLHFPPSYANAIGGSGATGWDWVIWTFQKARQYCPNSQLLLNDYGILGNTKNTSDYLKIIDLLKARGLIDGIGEQGHGLEYAQSSKIESSLDALAATGLPIYISELDVDLANDADQLVTYQRLFPLLYEHPGVAGVTLWGYLIGDTWKPNAHLLGTTNTVGTWTLTTNFQNYTASGSGIVRVHLTNDDANNANDVQVDYVVINGVIYQAENMPLNTGVWTGTCGGSFSEWIHCSGYIEFPYGSGTITVRARGVTGNEILQLRTLNDTVERPALQWLRNDYFGGGSGGGDVIAEAESGVGGGTVVANSRPGYSGLGYVTGFDMMGDYVEVTVNIAQAGSYPLVIRYASNVPVARSLKVNGSVVKKNLSFPASSTFTEVQWTTSFNAGNNTARIYVERGATAGGDIDYIKVSGASP